MTDIPLITGPVRGDDVNRLINATNTLVKQVQAADGNGTVTSVSVTTANGVSGSVATATTTPAITLTLGAITPTSVNASGTVLGSNLSGTNTGNQALFQNIAVSGQNTVVADTTTDTLTLVGAGITAITTNDTTDTITITSTPTPVIGSGASIGDANAVAYGNGASAGTGATAIGTGSSAGNGAGSFALGFGATATANKGTLGNGSTTDVTCGDGTANVHGTIIESLSAGLIATGTDRATALAIVSINNIFSTVAAGTGLVLPPATTVGKVLRFANFTNTADYPVVYAAGSDTINGVAGATGEQITVNISDGYDLVCSASGAWVTFRKY